MIAYVLDQKCHARRNVTQKLRDKFNAKHQKRGTGDLRVLFLTDFEVFNIVMKHSLNLNFFCVFFINFLMSLRSTSLNKNLRDPSIKLRQVV